MQMRLESEAPGAPPSSRLLPILQRADAGASRSRDESITIKIGNWYMLWALDQRLRMLLAAVPVAFLLLGVGRLIQWVLRIDNSLFSLGFICFAIFGAVLGASLYLDLRGEVVQGSVTHKSETIEYREEGDWRPQRRVTVAYTLPGQSLASATLSPPVAKFDQFREGEPVTLRVLNFGDYPSLVRLADQSTRTWLPWGWIGGVLALILVGVVLWKLSDTRVGCWPGFVFVVVLATVPFVNKWREWQQSEDPNRTPLRVSTTVVDVRRVTWLDPFPGKTNNSDEWETGFDVPQPYDIVTMRFRPQGYPDQVLAVDVVDAGQPAVRPGMAVVVEYGLDDPRVVRLLDARRLHYWKNPLGWVQSQMVAVAISFAISFGLGGLGYRFRQWWNELIARRRTV